MKNLHKIIFLTSFIFLFTGNSFAQIYEGNHFIGTGETYTNFTDAVSDLATTLTGEVIFNVRSGIYNEQVVLPDLTGGFSVTFRKADGETGEVLLNPDNFSNGNYVVQVNGSYYHFENINFINSSTTSDIGVVVDLADITDASNLAFYNCKFTGRTDLIAEERNNPLYSIINNTNDYYTNDISFTNDTIVGGSYSIYINNIAIASSRITILGCDINNFYNTGIYLTEVSDFTIVNNKITDRSDVEEIPAIGIITNSPDWNGFEISANKIDLQRDQEKTCIELLNVSDVSNYLVANNMLTSRGASAAYNSTGIKLTNSSYTSLLFNSIHIQDGNAESSAVDFSDATSHNLLLKNNLLINSGLGYALKVDNFEQSFDFDYNDYFASSGSIIKDNSINYDLAYWQQAQEQDINSFSALPNFIAPNDLHIQEGSLSYVEGRAMINSSVQTDIDGEQRDIDANGFADVGADEGMFTLLWTGDINSIVIWKDTVFIETDVYINSGPQKKSGTREGAGLGELTIEPGAVLKFKNSSSLIVEGSVNAIGTESQGIIFTSEGSGGSETWGGIISSPGTASVYEFCKFENAFRDIGYGGAFYIDSNNELTIKNCKFQNNSAKYGSAIATISCSPTIDANLFYNNIATIDGGAIYSEVELPKISNNIFVGNNSTNNGGAICFKNIITSPLNFYNNTFYNNNASIGEDLYLDNTQIEIYNSIFWNDGNQINIFEANGTTNSTTNCIIKNGLSGTNIQANTLLLGNDPQFVDPLNMNFSVQANSVAVDGGAYITDQNLENDYAGNPRIYDYATVDIGAFELQAPRLFADAGADVAFCYDGINYYPEAYTEYPYEGTWDIISGGANIVEGGGSKSKNMYYFNNFQPGVTKFLWSVTNGFITETDTLEINNLQPVADAGEDILLINPVGNDIFSPVDLNANTPEALENGQWLQVSTGGLLISDNTINNPTISNIGYGQHIFEWTITDTQTSCSNSDTILIVAGHSYSSIPDGTFDWNNPSDWQEGGLPGAADSVTIYGVNGNIGQAGAVCDRLYIGNGGTLNMLGSAKAETNLSCRILTVEENAKKFNGIKGSANLYVQDFATLNIGAEYVSKSRSASGSGLFIGSGGTVFIRPNAEKATKGTAGLNIGSGGFVFIRPNAEKSGSKASAGLNIGSGGFVFIRPNAEKHKTEKSITDGDIVIGSGASLNIEQTIAGTAGGNLELGSGRTIYLSPSVGKVAGGNFGIYGGTVFIRPNAEKSTKSVAGSGIYCGSGGTIFIRPNAEKAGSTSNLISPSLTIDGGKVIVGDNSKSKDVTGSLQFNQIFIRPNAEKGLAADTSLIIYPSGELVVNSVYSNMPQITVNEGVAVSFLEGSTIDMYSSFYLKEGSSLIDMNSTSDYEIITVNNFKGNANNLFSPCTKNFYASDFGDNKTLGTWDEATASWLPFNDADMLQAGKGYIIKYNWSDTHKYFYGTAQTGDINVPLTLTDVGNFGFEGWNLVGNPYSSSIDLEQIDLSSDIYSTFYSFNPIENNFKIYQKGGISLNGATQYITQNEAFFVKVDANSNFNFGNDARVHFVSSAKNPKVVNNILKLKVSGLVYSDETAISFNNDATDNFDKEYDAAKMVDRTITSPSVYTKITGENAPIAINTFKYQAETTRTIPLYFESPNSGSFSINVSELIFDPSVTVFLKDLSDNSMHNLKTSPTYTFDYTSGDEPNRFEVIFSGFIGVEDLANDEAVNIFSNKNLVFINTASKESRVEIYNLNGQLLLQKELSKSGVSSINTNLPQSIYLVKLITKDKTICKKVVLSK